MRSLFKLSLASLAAVALFAGMALAQDKPTLTVNLDLIGSLGQQSNTISTDTSAGPPKVKTDSANSGFISQWQADLNINAAMGDAGGRTKIRFRESGGTTPDAARSELWYNFGTSQLKFHISSWGLPVSLIAYPVYTGTTTTGGWPTDYAGPVAFWVNRSGLQYNANLGGGANAGIAIFDSCNPGCGYTPAGLSTLTTTTGVTGAGANFDQSSSGSKATQTLVPYYMGVFGQTTLGVFLGLSSGSVAHTSKDATGNVKDADKAVSGSLTDIQAKYDMGASVIAVEYSTVAQTCDKEALDFTQKTVGAVSQYAKCDPRTTTEIALGARINVGPNRVEVHYVTSALADSQAATTLAGGGKRDFTRNFSDLMLGYAIPMNSAFWLVPVYTSRTTTEEVKLSPKTGPSSKLDNTIGQTLIALGARGIF